MKFIKSHFWYTKSQRNGILFLLIILFSIQFSLYFIDFSVKQVHNNEEFALYQAKLDSLKTLSEISSQPKFYPFNPNYLTDFKAYQLGLSPEQIDRLFLYREKGQFVNTAKEFQSVTGINDSLLSIIAPYFKFPAWTHKKKIGKKKSVKIPPPDQVRDLNKVNAEELEALKIVNLNMAKRIIAYRNLLQGFSKNEQLYEVYYLKKETAHQLLKYFKVIAAPKLEQVDINSASFKELLKTPYLDYNLTKKICQFRDENDFFETLEDLKKIDSFPLEKFDRIALYLTVE